MKCSFIPTLIMLVSCVILHSSDSAPIDSNNPYKAVQSSTDITGQPVRQKRSQDYFICYPSSVVYGYYGNPNDLEPHRRSDQLKRRASVFDSYDALIARADRERAEYKDSFGK